MINFSWDETGILTLRLSEWERVTAGTASSILGRCNCIEFARSSRPPLFGLVCRGPVLCLFPFSTFLVWEDLESLFEGDRLLAIGLVSEEDDLTRAIPLGIEAVSFRTFAFLSTAFVTTLSALSAT